jgi:hypothetical protein
LLFFSQNKISSQAITNGANFINRDEILNIPNFLFWNFAGILKNKQDWLRPVSRFWLAGG